MHIGSVVCSSLTLGWFGASRFAVPRMPCKGWPSQREVHTPAELHCSLSRFFDTLFLSFKCCQMTLCLRTKHSACFLTHLNRLTSWLEPSRLYFHGGTPAADQVPAMTVDLRVLFAFGNHSVTPSGPSAWQISPQELYLRRGGGDTLFLWDDAWQLQVRTISSMQLGAKKCLNSEEKKTLGDYGVKLESQLGPTASAWSS